MCLFRVKDFDLTDSVIRVGACDGRGNVIIVAVISQCYHLVNLELRGSSREG